MLDTDNTQSTETTSTQDAADAPPTTGTMDGPDAPDVVVTADAEAPAKKSPAKKGATKKGTAKKAATRKTTAKKPAGEDAMAPAEATSVPGDDVVGDALPGSPSDTPGGPDDAPATASRKAPVKKAAKKAAARRTTKSADGPPAQDIVTTDEATDATTNAATSAKAATKSAPPAVVPLFKAPEPVVSSRRRSSSRPAGAPVPLDTDGEDLTEGEDPSAGAPAQAQAGPEGAQEDETADAPETDDGEQDGEPDVEDGGNRRRRRRGGRRRRKSGSEDSPEEGSSTDASATSDSPPETGRGRASASPAAAAAAAPAAADGTEGSGDGQDDGSESGSGSRRRRRRRRPGEAGDGSADAGENTVVRVRKPRNPEDEITSVSGSTRLEAKKQRRREGREAGRRRAPIVSEAEFLARREAVDRVMVIRQRKDLTQIAVLEDSVLVEHYVARESQSSMIGNVYLGRVQNVLPSMEAAFIDIGKGRNAVLYAGEVNWDALGAKSGGQRKIEQVLKSGQSLLVQVSKDPIGHKGARLTSQVSLPGRFLVYVPDGTTSGISRKLPDTERSRLKALLKEIVPESAGVIVRTAAEGASEEELTRDVERLKAKWADIEAKVAKGNAPALLYGEPDLTLKVVRDLFTEDFTRLVVSGQDAWNLVEDYVENVAPDLSERLERYDESADPFAEYRIDEQIAKGLDRKVWLPSGGSLVIDRTEAMTVVDVNTGKFTGSGGNLEETVTKNNLEAAEEIVRQLRLRDIGGIIVVDFIDMVLESNRDLVLRRMVECLGRDRTRHQVAEVTSLGLVQMTRKRIGTGLLEAFSAACDTCQGRGVVVQHEPVEPQRVRDEDPRGSRRGGRGRGDGGGSAAPAIPTPKDIAAIARPENVDRAPLDAPEPAGSEVEPVHPGPEPVHPGPEPVHPDLEPVQPGPEPVSPAPEPVRADPEPAEPGSWPEQSEPDRPHGDPLLSDADAAPSDAGSSPPVSVSEPVSTPPEASPVPARQPAARQRRRAAVRPTGPAAPAPSPTNGVAAAGEASPSVDTDEVDTAGVGSAPADVVPTGAPSPVNGVSSKPAPTIVTSTRRRGAVSRPAGPPQGGAVEAESDGAVLTEAPAAGTVDAAPHVPVKKRGTRRR